MIAPRSISVMLLSFAIVGFSGGPVFALADDDVVENVDVQPRFTISEQQFDQSVFNTRGAVVIANGGRLKQVVVSQTTPIEQAKSQLETYINAEIATVVLRCNLTETQKKKLRLAGRGDIADFFARVMELRRRCTSESMTQQEYTTLHAEMTKLRMMIQTGSISDATLICKTLRRILSDEQSVLYKTLERERRIAIITESLATQWGQNSKPVRLAKEAQQQFVDVLLQHGRLPTNQSPYRLYFVLLEIDRLEDRLKPLLSDEEWQQFQFPISQAKRIEPFLRTTGQWPSEEIVDETSSDAMKE